MNTSKIYKTYDIVLVPFPFVESSLVKKRPALVVSSSEFNNKSKHSALVMITSTAIKWPLDILINDFKNAGLSMQSIIRMKYFSLPNKLIIKKIGHLSSKDKENFQRNFATLFQDI